MKTVARLEQVDAAITPLAATTAGTLEAGSNVANLDVFANSGVNLACNWESVALEERAMSPPSARCYCCLRYELGLPIGIRSDSLSRNAIEQCWHRS